MVLLCVSLPWSHCWNRYKSLGM
ncbi:rCG21683 [Rattus norvegicus]|uniref:RCG21683 n=1 Tax=Rattus norvegicus TaxID=10116 RepID=A6J0R2_RAT|nr:rCG21683 [Rattus norvegicus]